MSTYSKNKIVSSPLTDNRKPPSLFGKTKPIRKSVKQIILAKPVNPFEQEMGEILFNKKLITVTKAESDRFWLLLERAKQKPALYKEVRQFFI